MFSKRLEQQQHLVRLDGRLKRMFSDVPEKPKEKNIISFRLYETHALRKRHWPQWFSNNNPSSQVQERDATRVSFPTISNRERKPREPGDESSLRPSPPMCVTP
ncbi:hypothetical protein QCA50_007264 [Cerrena zonata]|uniref:Uncharacterized protein n=1 Tax=Cerrena zonata TaxID=2478898 RepID=A0AAW0GHU2_9APHY